MNEEKNISAAIYLNVSTDFEFQLGGEERKGRMNRFGLVGIFHQHVVILYTFPPACQFIYLYRLKGL